MEDFFLKAQPRDQFGSKAARRYRQQALIPCVIYGHGEGTLAVSLDGREFRSFFDAGHKVATIRVDGREEYGVVKEVQYDALGTDLLHVDFSRVRQDETIVMEVRISTIGVPKSVAGGGVLETPLRELKVEGLAGKIPENIEVNIIELKIGEFIRVRDLPAPEGCTFVGDGEQVVVAVAAPKEELEGEAGELEPSEPEVIGRKKEEGENEEEGK